MEILLVDDDQVDRDLVKRTLKKSSLEVNIVEAVTVDEGLSHFRENVFDLILLDYRMPRRDGIEMIVELRNEPKDESTAIVMMSASENEELALECIKAGAQDFLVKSEISEPRLRRAILHATTRFELEKQLYLTYQKVKQLAETDTLTGLPNRYLFDESLKQAITSNRRSSHKLALILFDLDNFKYVNDTFGHDVGDLLLQRTVSRVQSCLRGNELFARLGGDEFAITLSNLTSIETASQVAKRIIDVLVAPIQIGTTDIHVTVSMGIAIHPDNGNSSEELFKHADIAMYRAKKQGKNQMSFFEYEMQQQFMSRVVIEQELREAIHTNQLELFYQPVITLDTGDVKGFEALIRWNNNGITRSPDDFIPIAEESGLINALGLKIIEDALSTVSQWNQKYGKEFTIAINISSKQLRDEVLVEKLRDGLEKYGLKPELVELEITETALLHDTETVSATINQLHNLGCKLALDDFGTGYSSISHLREFPISIVKIDKSLMPLSEQDAKHIALVRGLTSMVSILNLSIVAEGIEHPHHAELCKELKISRVQGYYYSKPLPKSDIEQRYVITQ